MMNDLKYHSDLAIPPGEYLEEVIDSLGMSKEELARRMGRPASKLSPIFKGEKAITAATALQLETVLNVPADLWVGLESEYRMTIARKQQGTEPEQLKREAGLVSSFCYRELATLGVVAGKVSAADKVRELQRFFGVASLLTVTDAHYRYQVAFRCGKQGKNPSSPNATIAWVRLGELKARGITCGPFNKSRLNKTITTIRGMTGIKPAEFQPRLIELLAAAGVALVFCPHLPGTKAHGATFWLGSTKAVVMVSIRGKWADVFWFSLMHELGHVILHGSREVFIEDDCDNDLEREQEADVFAADTLIPPAEYRHLTGKGYVRKEEILPFAQSCGVDAGIVVGRLQYDGMFKHEWGNDLRSRYYWSRKETVI